MDVEEMNKLSDYLCLEIAKSTDPHSVIIRSITSSLLRVTAEICERQDKISKRLDRILERIEVTHE